MSASICWICGEPYATDYCPRCGPPEAWGPTAEEIEAARAKCRHGVLHSVPCGKCEEGMIEDAIDTMVSLDEYRRRWREP